MSGYVPRGDAGGPPPGDPLPAVYQPVGRRLTLNEIGQLGQPALRDITLRFTAEQARQAAVDLGMREHRITLERISRDGESINEELSHAVHRVSPYQPNDSIVTTEYGLFDEPARPRYTIPTGWAWYERLGLWLLLKWCGY